jgi:hypothetical protein
VLDPEELLLGDGGILLPVANTDQSAADGDLQGPREPGEIEGMIAFGMRFFGHHALIW